MKEERLTEDLLARLLRADSIESYLDEGETKDRTFVEYLYELMEDRGFIRADVIRNSGLHATVVYDIFAGKSKPGRNNAIMLSFGLKCDLKETQRLLRLSGHAELWPKVKRDAIIAWCIAHGMTRAACDDELWRFKEKTLLGTGPLVVR